jgi:PAS domain S-box-containing protein
MHSSAVQAQDAYRIAVFFVVGAAISFLSFARDRARTALYRARERSTATLRQWEYLFEHAAWGIVLVDTPDLFMRAVNPAYASMHGYTPEELIGRPVAVTLAPESRASLVLNTNIADANGHHVYESLHLRKDGTTFPALIDFAAMKDQSGNVRFGAAYCQDITDQKQLQKRMQDAQKLESLGVLASGLAHDFNNLLASILGYASLASESPTLDDSTRANLAEVIRASEKAADLTRQMLAYSGKGQFVLQPVNLSSEVRGMAKVLQASVPQGVRLEFHLAGDIPSVNADPIQIQQLIVNLVANAGEALEGQAGIVKIRTGAEAPNEETLKSDVSMPAPQPGTYASLEVSDAGHGMDQDTISRIFDPFFTTRFPGRGLGLAAVSGIVRSIGGSIEVQSTLGVGSTFRVFLPPADIPERRPTPHSKAA